MSALHFADGVAAALTDDALFAAELSQLIPGQWSVLRANRPIAQIPRHMMPCWIMDQGSGATRSLSSEGEQFLTIGNYSQDFESSLGLTALWIEQDRDTAARQRAELPRLVAQLMLRHPNPGGIHGAWLEGWDTDAGTRHPDQLWIATLIGQYRVEQP